MSKLLTAALSALLTIYLAVLAPYVPGQCRYTPTCSVYARQAVRSRGAFIGSWLTIRRLTACTLWRGAGHDPVPEPLAPSRAR